MKYNKLIFASTLAFSLTLSALAGSPASYQVTGPVLELTDTTIVVKKGSDRWELARTAATKVTGDLKVGSKVTIQYTMTAVSADVKAGKASKAAGAASPSASPK